MITSVTNVTQMTDFHIPTTNAEPALKSSKIIHFIEIKIKNVNVDINPMLKFKEKLMLQNLINIYHDCFTENPTDIGNIDTGENQIPTTNEESISLPPYRLSIKNKLKYNGK